MLELNNVNLKGAIKNYNYKSNTTKIIKELLSIVVPFLIVHLTSCKYTLLIV